MENDKKIPYEDCGVSEDMFPYMGKCCAKKDAAFMFTYAKLCPHCRISTSLPEGASLKTSTIFECGRLEYGRRITE